MKLLRNFYLIFGILTSFSAFSQTLESEQLSDEWTLIQSENDVEIFVKLAEQQVTSEVVLTYAFLKVVNNSPSDKSITFNPAVQYTDICAGCEESNEQAASINISGNSTLIGDDSFELPQLSILVYNSALPYKQKLVSLSLNNTKIQ